MTISEHEYQLLNVILQEPQLSYTELAQRLELSVTSIRNLLFSLMDYSETKISEDDNTSLQTLKNDYKDNKRKNHNLAFFAKFNYDLLDLERVDFFIECENLIQIENVRKFCDAHPYTSYRTRIHGGKNGVYAIFFIPNEVLEMLLFSFETLKENEFIKNFTQIFTKSDVNIFSLLKVDVFYKVDPAVKEKNKWDFDFNTQINKFYEDIDSKNHVNYFKIEKEKPIIDRLDKIDLMILNEWGYGAGPRKTKAEILNNITTGDIYKEFSTDLKINRYIISDHVDSLLKENLIEYVGIGFDRRKIQIFTTLFYSGVANPDFLNSFANYIKSNYFPFESRFSIGDVTKDVAKFTWYVSLTPSIVSNVTEYLFRNSIKLETFIVILNPDDSETYPLYHANFIPHENTGGSWNTSEEFCLRNPLKEFFDQQTLRELQDRFHN